MTDDAFTPATSFLVVATVARDRYFDLDAVRTAHTAPNAGPQRGRAAQPKGMNSDAGRTYADGERMGLNPAGAPPLDWWCIDPDDDTTSDPKDPTTMGHARYIIGDTREVVESLPDGSIDLVLTSPPFLALRSYLPADHPDKAKEIGSEQTPADFLDTLLDLTELWRRKLAPHGSIVIELGDKFAGEGDAVSEIAGSGRGWPLDKSLCGIPWLYSLSLAYGRNLLRPERTTAPWRVRNVVAWCRPNPPVGSLGDKFRPGTSYLTVATVARDRYFDLDAVRSPGNSMDRDGEKRGNRKSGVNGTNGFARDVPTIVNHPAGAPPLDWWEIPTEPFSGSHYATWPRKLLTRPILSMCPQKVCRVCGEPSRRITEAFTLDSYRASTRPQTIKAVALAGAAELTDEHIAAVRAFGTSDAGKAVLLNYGAGKNTDEVKRLAGEAKTVLGGYFREFVQSTTAARSSTWTDCGHDSWRPGIVLDPFAGSGTTLAVATGLGRDAVGIDLDGRNAWLAMERVGMFLEVEGEVPDPLPPVDLSEYPETPWDDITTGGLI